MAPKRIKVRPGKTQSKFGVIVGVLFILIGCFVAIPIFGPLRENIRKSVKSF